MNKLKSIITVSIVLLFAIGAGFYYGDPIFKPFGNSTYFKDSTNYITINDGFFARDSIKTDKDLIVKGKINLDTLREIQLFADGYDFYIANAKAGNIVISATNNNGNIFLRSNFAGQEYLIGTGSHKYSWNKTEGLFQIEIMSLDTINGLKVNQGGIGSYDDTRGFVRSPNLTTTERNALTAETGFVIWNTTDGKLQVFNGITWDNLH